MNAFPTQEGAGASAQRQSWSRSGFWRGLSGRCPNCGQGPLLTRYLTVVSPCRVCGHDNAQYPSDDAPPYFTILIVGHLVVAPLLLLPFIRQGPIWLVIALTLSVVGASALILLPRVKGAVIGAEWAIQRRETAPRAEI